MLFVVFAFNVSCSKKSGDDPVVPAVVCTYQWTGQWTEYSANPVINSQDALAGIIWNDPSVMKEGNSYVMWLSGGTGIGVNHVRIYQATSADGVAWTINTAVLLEPDPTITVSGTGVPSDISGTYSMANELDIYNLKPKFKHDTEAWYLWYNDSDLAYYLSTSPGDTVTASWKNSSASDSSLGTYPIDGTYEPVSGSTGSPVVSSAWDSEKTETPMVVKDNSGTYHMYYSGFKMGDGPGRYQTGHATSFDGMSWTKDTGNPVLSYHEDIYNWGFYQVAEPGVVYDPVTGTFYLYYVTSKYRGAGYSSDMSFMQGIALSTSTNGSIFTHYDVDSDDNRDAVLVQSPHYTVENNFRGYSTPFPMIDSDGLFHLFYSVVNYPTPGAWSQIAIAHATSNDGKSFTEIEYDILTNGLGDWKNSETWGPSVLQENDRFTIWFAGQNGIVYNAGTGLYDGIFGIGYAWRDADCQ